MAYKARAEEVARATGFQPDTIYRWARDEYIPHVKVGRGSRKSLRFDMAEVAKWLEEKRCPGRKELVKPDSPRKQWHYPCAECTFEKKG
jgi:excisionase family DNA binding protein